MLKILLIVSLGAFCANAFHFGIQRAQVEDYLKEVYFAPSANDWAALSDDQIFDLFNNLTFYYPEANPLLGNSRWTLKYPGWNGREESHPYAGTVCDCLHVSLDMCQTFSPTATCAYWPLKTFLNMDYVMKFKQGFPSDSWFEGITYPGEWAFPESCVDKTLESTIYGFDNHVWLYPSTGVGVWWNLGKTSWAYNKVDWLLQNAIGKTINGKRMGATATEVMDTLADISCPGYKTRTGTACDTCPYSQTGDPTKCCCHGAGQNLGTQVLEIKAHNPAFTINDALNEVAKYYQTGMLGQGSSNYPVGTYFGYRNMLDPYFISLQQTLRIDSIQFIREPQHTGGSGTPSSPGYAFEVLFNKASWSWSWSTLCSSSSLALLNPLEHLSTYTEDGFIPNSAVAAKLNVNKWQPTPEFAKLVARKQQNANVNMMASSSYYHQVGAGFTVFNVLMVVGGIVLAIKATLLVFIVVKKIRKSRQEKMMTKHQELGTFTLPGISL